jgi:large subunit ribosomal protein L25
MKTVSIDAEPRGDTGKGSARGTRREGRIPGVLYGQGKNIPLSVDRRGFVRALVEAHGENLIFDVNIPGEKTMKAIAREIQHDPITRSALHVDFQHIDMSKTIHLDIVVNLVGEPEGVKNFGGVLEHPGRTVEIETLPANIPSSIEVDVSHLMVGDSIHVSDLPAEGFTFLDEETRVIAQVAAPTIVKTAEEEAAEAEAAAEGEEGAEVKAEGEEEAKGEGDGEG